jgi:hypothetical protein
VDAQQRASARRLPRLGWEWRDRPARLTDLKVPAVGTVSGAQLTLSEQGADPGIVSVGCTATLIDPMRRNTGPDDLVIDLARARRTISSSPSRMERAGSQCSRSRSRPASPL